MEFWISYKAELVPLIGTLTVTETANLRTSPERSQLGDLPVIPVNIRARNSALFYLFDFIHPTLRDITLFHETLNKHRQPYRITVGERTEH